MTISLGLSTQWGFNPWWYGAWGPPPQYTSVQQLANIDARKDQMAGILGLGTGWEASKHLYPALYAIWSDPNVDGAGASRPAPWGGFPDSALLQGLGQRRIVPMVNWNHGATAYARNQTWADGGHDAMLDEWSAQANRWRDDIYGSRDFDCNAMSPDIILRFWWECNATWFWWAPYNTTGGQGNTDDTFKNGWKHIHDRIRIHNGADHVKLLYCGHHGNRDPSLMFPGDQWVQYNGFDAYTEPGLYPSAKDLIDDEMRRFQKHSQLPIIIAETGIAKSDDGATRALWFTNDGGLAALQAEFPLLRVFVYFDIDATPGGGVGGNEAAHRVWLLARNSQVINAWAVAQNSFPARFVWNT